MSARKQKEPNVQCYLAGPDVFYPDAIERGASKKQLLAAAGLNGHFPFDNEVPSHLFEEGGAKASEMIAEENERMMMRCIGNGDIGAILINMTPWRGPEMDTGTAFETGFFSALRRMGKPVILVGYYNEPTPNFFERTREWNQSCSGNDIMQDANGTWRDSNGHALEKFGANQDNLMIDESIKRAGGHVCHSFEEAVALTAKLSAVMKKEIAAGPQAPMNEVSFDGRVSPQPNKEKCA